MTLPKKSGPGDITSLLIDYRGGNPKALETLMPLVYEQLKRMAASRGRNFGSPATLSPTALVHEVFLKLREDDTLALNDRTHFFAVAAQSMRWLLTDHARAKTRDKRGGDAQRVVFDESFHTPEAEGVDVKDLAEALAKLEKQDPRLCRVVELRQLAGLSLEEVAATLGVSTRTVKRDWVLAKAWLLRELKA